MKIYYKDGPPKVGMGSAGEFVKDEPKEVDNKLAERLLTRKDIKFYKASDTPKKGTQIDKEEI